MMSSSSGDYTLSLEASVLRRLFTLVLSYLHVWTERSGSCCRSWLTTIAVWLCIHEELEQANADNHSSCICHPTRVLVQA